MRPLCPFQYAPLHACVQICLSPSSICTHELSRSLAQSRFQRPSTPVLLSAILFVLQLPRKLLYLRRATSNPARTSLISGPGRKRKLRLSRAKRSRWAKMETYLLSAMMIPQGRRGKQEQEKERGQHKSNPQMHELLAPSTNLQRRCSDTIAGASQELKEEHSHR